MDEQKGNVKERFKFLVTVPESFEYFARQRFACMKFRMPIAGRVPSILLKGNASKVLRNGRNVMGTAISADL